MGQVLDATEGPEQRVVITGLFDFFDVSASELAMLGKCLPYICQGDLALSIRLKELAAIVGVPVEKIEDRAVAGLQRV